MTVTRHVTRDSHRESRQTFDRYTEPTLTDPSVKCSTSLRPRPIDVEAVMAETDHFVCCHHEHATYCGLTDPLPFDGWVDEVPCAACMAVVAMDPENVYCPVEGVCSHVLALCSCPDDKP